MQRLEPISPFGNSNQPLNPVNSSNISTTARTLIPFHQDTLLFLYTNADSLLNKLPELSILTADHTSFLSLRFYRSTVYTQFRNVNSNSPDTRCTQITTDQRAKEVSPHTPETATIVENLCDYNCSESLWIKIK